MVVPISRMTRALSLVILATESSAFGLQSLHPLSSSWFNTVNRPSRVAQSAVLRVQHQRVRASIPRRPWSRAASPCRRGAPGSFPFMVAESDESAEGVRAKVISCGKRRGARGDYVLLETRACTYMSCVSVLIMNNEVPFSIGD